MTTEPLTPKQKFKFSIKVYFICAIWGMIATFLFLPETGSASFFGYVLVYINIILGPLTGVMQFRTIPFFLALIPLAIASLAVWYILLRRENTKPAFLIPPIIVWIAISSWVTFWYILTEIYS